jgi:hypothetical protein
VDGGLDALKKFSQGRDVEVGVVLDGNPTRQSAPSGDRSLLVGRFDPFEREVPAVRAVRRDPRDCELGDRVAFGLFEPAAEVGLGHFGFVGDEAGEVHRIVDAGVIEVERELVVLLDRLLVFFEVLDLDAEEGAGDAVIAEDAAVALGPERLDFLNDLGCGHGVETAMVLVVGWLIDWNCIACMKHKSRVSERDLSAVLERCGFFDALEVFAGDEDEGAVAGAEVGDRPRAVGELDFGVFARDVNRFGEGSEVDVDWAYGRIESADHRTAVDRVGIAGFLAVANKPELGGARCFCAGFGFG